MKKEKAKPKEKTDKKPNLWQRFLGLIFTVNMTPEAAKKKKLKEIAKALNKTRYGKWYKASASELKPPIAEFFYNIYKVIGPSKAVLMNANASKVLKSVTVECFLTEGQLQLAQGLTDKAIEERAASAELDSFVAQAKKELNSFVTEFNNPQVLKADLIYEHMDSFINFVLFDFYFFLKKFDTAIQENNFAYNANFQQIKGEYVLDAIKDFATVLYALPETVD